MDISKKNSGIFTITQYTHRRLFIAFLWVGALLLSGCGGGGNGSGDNITKNNLPSSNAGADQKATENQTVTLTGIGSDVEGDISYVWSQTSGITVEINNSNMAVANFNAPNVTADTVLTFKLTVTDKDGLSASDLVNITLLKPAIVSNNNFNRRIKLIKTDLDNNGIFEGIENYNYNADGTIDSIVYIYTDDGFPDVSASALQLGQDNQISENKNSLFTYTTDGNIDVFKTVFKNSSTEFKYSWISSGMAQSLNSKTFSFGVLESEIDAFNSYGNGLLISVHADVLGTPPSTIDLTLEYNSSKVLQADLLTISSGSIIQKTKREYTWNNDGSIATLREFNPDPNSNYEDKRTYSYKNKQLDKRVDNNSSTGLFSKSFNYATNGLLESIALDIGNDSVIEAKIFIEWENDICKPTTFWAVRAFPDRAQAVPKSPLYTSGDGHFSDGCGTVN